MFLIRQVFIKLVLGATDSPSPIVISHINFIWGKFCKASSGASYS